MILFILRNLTVFLLLAMPFAVVSQNAKTKSIRKKLESSKDTLRINLLHDLAFEYWNFDVEEAYQITMEGLRLSEEYEFKKGLAWSNTNIGLYHYFKGDYPSALKFYRKAIKTIEGQIYGKFPSYTLTRIANLYSVQGQYDSALYYHHQALQYLPKKSSKENYSSIRYNIGVSYLEMERFDSAKHYLRYSLRTTKQLGDSLLFALSLKEMGRLFLKTKDFDSSNYYLNKAKEIGEQFNLPEINIYYAIYNGQLELEKGNYYKAIESIKSSLSLLNEYDFKQLRVKSLYLLGEIYSEIGEYDGAIDNLLKAESLNSLLSNKKQEAQINFILGYVFYYQKNLEKARQLANLAKSQFHEIGLKKQEAATNNLLGLIELYVKNYEASSNYFDLGMTIYKELGEKKGIASILYNKSYIFLEQGETQKVVKIQREALALEEEINNIRGIIISYNALGDIFISIREYDSAELYLLKARELLALHPSFTTQEENNEYLSKLYYATSDYKKAYEYQKLAKQNSDSVFSINSLNKSLQLSAIHDLEKKEIEIVNLNKEQRTKNIELALQESQLSQQKLLIYIAGLAILFFVFLSYILVRAIKKLRATQQELIKAEKRASMSILVSGLGHEINNPLNFINGGVLALKRTKKAWTKDQNKFFNAIEEGISRTTHILDILNKFQKKKSQQYQKCELKSIIEDCIEEMKGDIDESKKITFSSHGKTAFTKGIDSDLKQLFKELLKNSIQSIENVGEISIEVSSSASKFIVIIKDNGAGIDKNNLTLLENLFFTTKDPNKGKGLGLYLVDYILHEHNGKIHFDSVKGEGTVVTVSFPK
jgi:signal transduction histidine kinase